MTALEPQSLPQDTQMRAPAPDAPLPPALLDIFDRSNALVQKGQIDEARAILEEATAQFPLNPLAHYNLSVAYFLRLRQAMEDHDLWDPEAHEEGFFQGALAELEATLELSPEFTPALNNLGTLLLLRHDREQARAIWRRSLEIEPNQPWLSEDLAIIEHELSAENQ